MSTYLYISFSKLRQKEFIPFIHIDIQKIENFCNNNHDLLDYIYFSIMNLFIDYKTYSKFFEKIFLKIKNKEYQIEDILITII